MKTNYKKKLWMGSALVFGMVACGTKHNSGSVASNTPAASSSSAAGAGSGTSGTGAPGPSVNLKFISAGTETSDGLSLYNGQTTAGDLQSLKYFLTNISICKHATVSTSGFSDATDCLPLYTNSKATKELYDRMDQTEAAKPEYANDFKDLIQGFNLSASISQSNVGTYRYALVNWMKPIKVTAQVTLNDAAGTVLYTHPGTYRDTVDQNGVVHNDTLVPAMATGPATEAIAMLQNGGSVFAFASPFTITSADIASNTQFALDMVFNPDGIIKGADNGVALSNIYDVSAAGQATGPSIAVPFLSLIPLVHKAEDDVVKETYLVHFPAGITGTAETADATPTVTTDPFDIRLELYYLKDASEVVAGHLVSSDLSESIYGAHEEMMFVNTATARTVQGPMGVPNINSLTQDPVSRLLDFNSWQGSPATLGHMLRLARIGNHGQLQLRCGQGGIAMSTAGCYNQVSHTYPTIRFDVDYELVGRDGVTTLSNSSIRTVRARSNNHP